MIVDEPLMQDVTLALHVVILAALIALLRWVRQNPDEKKPANSDKNGSERTHVR